MVGCNELSFVPAMRSSCFRFVGLRSWVFVVPPFCGSATRGPSPERTLRFPLPIKYQRCDKIRFQRQGAATSERRPDQLLRDGNQTVFESQQLLSGTFGKPDARMACVDVQVSLTVRLPQALSPSVPQSLSLSVPQSLFLGCYMSVWRRYMNERTRLEARLQEQTRDPEPFRGGLISIFRRSARVKAVG